MSKSFGKSKTPSAEPGQSNAARDDTQLLQLSGEYPSTYADLCSIGYTTSTRSAKRQKVLSFVNKDNFSLPLINTKRLRSKILSEEPSNTMRKTLRNYKTNNTLDYNTKQDWFRKHSSIESCVRKLELLNRLLDIDEGTNNFYERYDVKIMTEQKFMCYFQESGQTGI